MGRQHSGMPVRLAAWAVIVAIAATGAAGAGAGPMVTVGSGHWGSTSWAVAASDTAGGRVCMTLRLGTGARSGFCGIVRRRAMRPGDAYGLTLTAGRSIAVSYVVGAVRSTARTV